MARTTTDSVCVLFLYWRLCILHVCYVFQEFVHIYKPSHLVLSWQMLWLTMSRVTMIAFSWRTSV